VIEAGKHSDEGSGNRVSGIRLVVAIAMFLFRRKPRRRYRTAWSSSSQRALIEKSRATRRVMKRRNPVMLLGGLMMVLGLGIGGAKPAAAAVDSNEVFQEVDYVYSDCTGEVVEIDAKIHLLFSTTVDANGGLHIFGRANGAGTHAVGLDSGNRYEAPVHNTFFQFEGTAGGTTTFSAPFGYVLVSHGKLPNTQVSALLHVTVNPDGTVTADVENFSIECRG
jgi:hypothetical protein